MEFDFESPELQRFSDALERYAQRGLPYAARNTLNRSAFKAREIWVDTVRDTFTLRNSWTVRSIRVDKARGTNPLTMVSRVGSVAEYMETQEEGGVERKTGRHGVAIPTSAASGQGRSGRRTKPVRRPNQLRNIQLAGRRAASSRKQRNAIAIKTAIAAGRKFVFLELDDSRQGIFRIRGRRRVDLVWDLSRPSVRIPASKTLGRTIRKLAPSLPDIAIGALVEQLRFNRVTDF